MPDRSHHTPDSFADQGWSEMKKLLDREMPVRPIPFFRRRKGLLWLLLLLIPLSAAWGYYQWNAHKPSASPPMPTPEKPLALDPPIAAATASEENEEICRDLPVSKQVIIPVMLAKKADSDIEPGIALNSQLIVHEKNEVLAYLPATLEPIAQVHAFPGAAVEASPLIIPVRRATPQFAVEAGPFASAGFRSGGASAGLRVVHTLGSKGWGVQAGLGYSFFSKPFPAQILSRNTQLNDLAESIANTGIPVDFSSNGSSLNSLASSADSIVSQLHFLDIPISATYRTNRRWLFHAGGGLSLLLAARTETGTDAGYGLLNNHRSRLDFSSISSNEVVAFSMLRNVTPFLEAGVTYFPWTRIGISAQGQVGVRDMLPQWPGRQGLHKAQLKVSYWF